MQAFITFLSDHTFLTGALVIVLVLLLILESWRAKQMRSALTPAEAVYQINREHAVVIDLRTKDQFLAGHIIAAQSIPAADIATHHKKKWEKWRNKPLVFVCPDGLVSKKIAAQFGKEGFTTYAVNGGMRAWVAAKLPIVKGASS